MRRALPSPRATYTDWWWPPPPTMSRTISRGYSSFEHVLVPEVDVEAGSGFLWAHRFVIVGGGSGMVALGEAGDWMASGPGKVALLSISETTMETTHFPPLGGPGNSWNCRLPFDWKVGQQYLLQVWTDRQGSWSAAVGDVSTRQQQVIGQVQVPRDWRGLDAWSVMTTEYYGPPVSSCDHVPHSSVVFGSPTADRGSVSPEQSQSRLGGGGCEGSRVDVVDGGVRHEVGRHRRRH